MRSGARGRTRRIIASFSSSFLRPRCCCCCCCWVPRNCWLIRLLYDISSSSRWSNKSKFAQRKKKKRKARCEHELSADSGVVVTVVYRNGFDMATRSGLASGRGTGDKPCKQGCPPVFDDSSAAWKDDRCMKSTTANTEFRILVQQISLCLQTIWQDLPKLKSHSSEITPRF